MEDSELVLKTYTLKLDAYDDDDKSTLNMLKEALNNRNTLLKEQNYTASKANQLTHTKEFGIEFRDTGMRFRRRTFMRVVKTWPDIKRGWESFIRTYMYVGI